MQPAFYIKIDKIPLNANGKFKRNELPAPDFKSYVKEYVAPSNEMEEKLCSVMASILGINRVGVTDDFYEIGGKVYFGEYTFFEGGGFQLFKPAEWEERLGSWIDISK